MNKYMLPSSVKTFSGGNEDVYVMFKDYWNHYRTEQLGAKGLDFDKTNADGKLLTFSDKETQMNKMIHKEIARVSGVTTFETLPFELWASNPTVLWASFAVVSQMIDAVLPETLIDSIGLYTDIRTIGFGDSAAFDIEPRDLFVVSKSGRGMRQAEIKKQYRGQVTVLPENHTITVAVSLYRVLAGKESLASFVAKAVRSVESEITVDAYNAFATAMAALSSTAGNTQLQVSGYAQDDLIRLCQKVGAWNGGSRPVILGTVRALGNVLPVDANYRYDLESDFVKIGYVRNFVGYDVMALPQVADWTTEFAVRLDDTKLWIVSPTSQKLIKLVLEGSTLSNVTGQFDAATLQQKANLHKSWGVAVASSSLAATIAL